MEIGEEDQVGRNFRMMHATASTHDDLYIHPMNGRSRLLFADVRTTCTRVIFMYVKSFEELLKVKAAYVCIPG